MKTDLPSMIDEESIVLPGDKIAVSEELQSGEGTYIKDGEIRASIIGKFIIDRKKMTAKINPVTNAPLLLRSADEVICEVSQVGEAMVIAKILRVIGTKRQIAGENDAALHVSNISNEYTESTKSKYRIGDILRAKIIQANPVVRLSTKNQSFGVRLENI